MSSFPLSAFDTLAARYDELWTNTHAGRLQRDAVWRHLDPLIQAGDSVLDLGCGTGEDALRLARLGASVTAIDASSAMVEVARNKGVHARVMRMEEIAILDGAYDAVISNFGALNCVPDLSILRAPLERLIRPGGYLAICLMGPFCLWEFAYYAVRGKFSKATRRWRGGATASIGVRVYYPSLRHIRNTLSPSFTLAADVGIGVCVPPSFVRELPSPLIDCLGRMDARIGRSRMARVMGDHRLLVFFRS